MSEPTSSGPSVEVRRLANEILAHDDHGGAYPYALGFLESHARQVVADPSPENLHRLMDTLSGIQLAMDERLAVQP